MMENKKNKNGGGGIWTKNKRRVQSVIQISCIDRLVKYFLGYMQEGTFLWRGSFLQIFISQIVCHLLVLCWGRQTYIMFQFDIHKSAYTYSYLGLHNGIFNNIIIHPAMVDSLIILVMIMISYFLPSTHKLLQDM